MAGGRAAPQRGAARLTGPVGAQSSGARGLGRGALGEPDTASRVRAGTACGSGGLTARGGGECLTGDRAPGHHGSSAQPPAAAALKASPHAQENERGQRAVVCGSPPPPHTREADCSTSLPLGALTGRTLRPALPGPQGRAAAGRREQPSASTQQQRGARGPPYRVQHERTHVTCRDPIHQLRPLQQRRVGPRPALGLDQAQVPVLARGKVGSGLRWGGASLGFSATGNVPPHPAPDQRASGRPARGTMTMTSGWAMPAAPQATELLRRLVFEPAPLSGQLLLLPFSQGTVSCPSTRHQRPRPRTSHPHRLASHHRMLRAGCSFSPTPRARPADTLNELNLRTET